MLQGLIERTTGHLLPGDLDPLLAQIDELDPELLREDLDQARLGDEPELDQGPAERPAPLRGLEARFRELLLVYQPAREQQLV
jgi:hypothetical protein